MVEPDAHLPVPFLLGLIWTAIVSLRLAVRPVRPAHARTPRVATAAPCHLTPASNRCSSRALRATLPSAGGPGRGSTVTTSENGTGQRIDRWSGRCLVAAGGLLLLNVAHPDVFDTTFGHAARDTALWVPIHAGLLVAVTLSLAALLGLYARHAGQLGRLGAVGFTFSLVGMVVAACAFYWEAFLLPPIARQDPELFAWDGPVVTDWGVRSGALAGLWVVGLALLAIALGRAGVLPRAVTYTFTLSAAAFALLAGPFVPVLDVLATIVFAASYAWLGVALWTHAGMSAESSARTPTVPTRQG